ncbi:hypothetical protein V5799_014071 [Amblyomma americanum]|uniref:TIL domain-containing protein n=1 Tax=Amblyomma americanum TaxID=6943 RepID=A0AAQ4E431_AMBAM
MKMHATTTAFELCFAACLLCGLTIARFLRPRREHPCPPGQTYLDCASPDCREFTCRRMTLPENCTIECLSGCFCLHNRFRNKHGHCVTFEECAAENHKIPRKHTFEG